MSRPIGEMRITLPQAVSQVYAGDLAAARTLNGRSVQAAPPGAARAARAQEQQRIAAPPALWKRLLNFIGLRKFTPEEALRAKMHDVSKQLSHFVVALGTKTSGAERLTGSVARANESTYHTLAKRFTRETLAPLANSLLRSLDMPTGGVPKWDTVVRQALDARLNTAMRQLDDHALAELSGRAKDLINQIEWRSGDISSSSSLEYALTYASHPERMMVDAKVLDLASAIASAVDSEIISRERAATAPPPAPEARPLEPPQSQMNKATLSTDSRTVVNAVLQAASKKPVLSLEQLSSRILEDTSRSRSMQFTINNEPLPISNASELDGSVDRLNAIFGEDRAKKILPLLDQTLTTPALAFAKGAQVQIGDPPQTVTFARASGGGFEGANVHVELTRAENGDCVFNVKFRRPIGEFYDTNDVTHRLDPTKSHLDIEYSVRQTDRSLSLVAGVEPKMSYHFEPLQH